MHYLKAVCEVYMFLPGPLINSFQWCLWKTEKEISHQLIYSPNIRSSWGWVRTKARILEHSLGIQCQCQWPSCLSCCLPSPKEPISRKLGSGPELGFEHSHSSRGCGNPRWFLEGVPNTCQTQLQFCPLPLLASCDVDETKGLWVLQSCWA